MVAHDRSYYATGECKEAVAGHVRQVVVDGRDCSMGKQSVLTKVVINARWSSMAGVAQNRFYCIPFSSLIRFLAGCRRRRPELSFNFFRFNFAFVISFH